MAARSKSSGARKTGARKAAGTRKGHRQRAQPARKRLKPASRSRGLAARALALDPDAPELAAVRERVEQLGGAALGAYREPLSGRPLLFASVPIAAVEPTPFQRDLSPTHTKRLAEKIEETGAFLDPLIAVLGPDERLWTPNGRHRLAAARVLGLASTTVLISADAALAYRILALNTEKAHNLKDRSLEAIRMARALAEQRPRAKETEFAAEFEAPALLTLGAVYEQNKRFAGSAYHPMLRRVDAFSSRTLRRSLGEREGWAARLIEIDQRVAEHIEELRERGFRSPYLRTLIVARVNPVRPVGRGRAARSPSMTLPAALTRLWANLRRFDTSAIRERDLALLAAVTDPSE